MVKFAPSRFPRQRWRSGGEGKSGEFLSKTSKIDIQVSRNWKRKPPRHHQWERPADSQLRPPKSAAWKLTTLGVLSLKLVLLVLPKSKRWASWMRDSPLKRNQPIFHHWWCLMLAHTSRTPLALQFHGENTYGHIFPQKLMIPKQINSLSNFIYFKWGDSSIWICPLWVGQGKIPWEGPETMRWEWNRICCYSWYGGSLRQQVLQLVRDLGFRQIIPNRRCKSCISQGFPRSIWDMDLQPGWVWCWGLPHCSIIAIPFLGK